VDVSSGVVKYIDAESGCTIDQDTVADLGAFQVGDWLFTIESCHGITLQLCGTFKQNERCVFKYYPIHQKREAYDILSAFVYDEIVPLFSPPVFPPRLSLINSVSRSEREYMKWALDKMRKKLRLGFRECHLSFGNLEYAKAF
jgi:hypothetical protein